VFTLLTEAPLSENGYLRGTWLGSDEFNAPPSPSPPLRSPSSAAASASASPSAAAAATPTPSPDPAELEAQREAEAERSRAAAQEAWWNEGSSRAAAVDPFAHDDETSGLLEFVQSLLDEEVDGVALTAQQASVLRYLTLRPFEPARALLRRLQAAQAGGEQQTETAARSFLSELDPLVAHQLEVEEACRDLQLEELAALQSIFGSSTGGGGSDVDASSRELSIYQTHPPTLKVVVVLQAIDCTVELGFAMPASYPLEEPLIMQSFVPPPFQGLKIRRDGSAIDTTSGSGDADLVSVDELLHSDLLSAVGELVGEQSVYSVVERARSFMEQHESILRVSLATREAEQVASSSAARVLQHDAVQLFGRGDVERLEFAAIAQVQQQCDVPESLARAGLKESKWDVQHCVREFRNKQAAEDATAANAAAASSASSSSLPGVMSPLVQRQASNSERARFDALQTTFAPYVSDATLTLSCAACCEDLQLREVAGQVCGHVMCLQCWRRMLSGRVAQGEAFVRCVGFKCACAVEEGLILCLLSQHAYQLYRRRLQDSFIQLRGWKWCVNAQCDKVVSVADGAPKHAVVSCTCHAQYCFACSREGHWPVSCSAARQYESSQLVRAMRTRVSINLVSVKREDDVLRVELKRCPKCKTPWEKHDGCNHFKCGTCGHHFCWVCLNEWASHGVSWYQCVFSSSQEKRAERMTFSPGVALTGALDHVWVLCERELVHFVAMTRAGRILNEIADRQQQQQLEQQGKEERTAAGAEAGTAASGASQFPPELPSLLSALEHPSLSSLSSLLLFVRDAHAILRSSYIFLILHYSLFDASLHPTKRSSGANQLLADLNQFEYFTDALDMTLMPLSSSTSQAGGAPSVAVVNRIQRSMVQLAETASYVRKYASAFARTLDFFTATELKHEDDELNTEKFFKALDNASTAAAAAGKM